MPRCSLCPADANFRCKRSGEAYCGAECKARAYTQLTEVAPDDLVYVHKDAAVMTAVRAIGAALGPHFAVVSGGKTSVEACRSTARPNYYVLPFSAVRPIQARLARIGPEDGDAPMDTTPTPPVAKGAPLLTTVLPPTTGATTLTSAATSAVAPASAQGRRRAREEGEEEGAAAEAGARQPPKRVRELEVMMDEYGATPADLLALLELQKRMRAKRPSAGMSDAMLHVIRYLDFRSFMNLLITPVDQIEQVQYMTPQGPSVIEQRVSKSLVDPAMLRGADVMRKVSAAIYLSPRDLDDLVEVFITGRGTNALYRVFSPAYTAYLFRMHPFSYPTRELHANSQTRTNHMELLRSQQTITVIPAPPEHEAGADEAVIAWINKYRFVCFDPPIYFRPTRALAALQVLQENYARGSIDNAPDILYLMVERGLFSGAQWAAVRLSLIRHRQLLTKSVGAFLMRFLVEVFDTLAQNRPGLLEALDVLESVYGDTFVQILQGYFTTKWVTARQLTLQEVLRAFLHVLAWIDHRYPVRATQVYPDVTFPGVAKFPADISRVVVYTVIYGKLRANANVAAWLEVNRARLDQLLQTWDIERAVSKSKWEKAYRLIDDAFDFDPSYRIYERISLNVAHELFRLAVMDLTLSGTISASSVSAAQSEFANTYLAKVLHLMLHRGSASVPPAEAHAAFLSGMMTKRPLNIVIISYFLSYMYPDQVAAGATLTHLVSIFDGLLRTEKQGKAIIAQEREQYRETGMDEAAADYIARADTDMLQRVVNHGLDFVANALLRVLASSPANVFYDPDDAQAKRLLAMRRYDILVNPHVFIGIDTIIEVTLTLVSATELNYALVKSIVARKKDEFGPDDWMDYFDGVVASKYGTPIPAQLMALLADELSTDEFTKVLRAMLRSILMVNAYEFADNPDKDEMKVLLDAVPRTRDLYTGDPEFHTEIYLYVYRACVTDASGAAKPLLARFPPPGLNEETGRFLYTLARSYLYVKPYLQQIVIANITPEQHRKYVSPALEAVFGGRDVRGEQEAVAQANLTVLIEDAAADILYDFVDAVDPSLFQPFFVRNPSPSSVYRMHEFRLMAHVVSYLLRGTAHHMTAEKYAYVVSEQFFRQIFSALDMAMTAIAEAIGSFRAALLQLLGDTTTIDKLFTLSMRRNVAYFIEMPSVADVRRAYELARIYFLKAVLKPPALNFSSYANMSNAVTQFITRTELLVEQEVIALRPVETIFSEDNTSLVGVLATTTPGLPAAQTLLNNPRHRYGLYKAPHHEVATHKPNVLARVLYSTVVFTTRHTNVEELGLYLLDPSSKNRIDFIERAWQVLAEDLSFFNELRTVMTYHYPGQGSALGHLRALVAHLTQVDTTSSSERIQAVVARLQAILDDWTRLEPTLPQAPAPAAPAQAKIGALRRRRGNY